MCYHTLGSTSDQCKIEADRGAAHGLAILAHRQTAGRGTRGRSWEAQQGNLTFSFLCRHERLGALVQVMPFLVAVAVHDALSTYLPGANLYIKWPNDLLCDGAKLGGILVERGGTADSGWIVTGIGVNLCSAPQIDGRSAICVSALGCNVAAEELAGCILKQFDSWLVIWESGGFAPIRVAWLSRAHKVGSPLAVQRGETYITGFFAGLDERGRLLLQTDTSEIQSFVAGDILLLG